MTDAARRKPAAWLPLWVTLAVLLYGAIRARRDLVDFEVYRTAAIRAQAAEPLYRAEDGHYQFKYLPAFAVLAAPVAWADAEDAKAVWFGLNCGLLLILFRLSALHVPNRRHAMSTLIAVTAIVTGKLWVKELVQGQTNLWLATLAFGAMFAVGRKRPKLAGALVGLAVFVKPYAAVFLPWLAVAAGVSSLAVCGAAVLAGLLLPVVRYGWSGNVAQHLDWWRTVTETSTANLTFGENISIPAMWTKWIGAGPTANALALSTSLVLVAAVLSMFIRRRRVPTPSFLEIAALLAIVPLLSPQGWDYVALLGIPMTMAIVDRWTDVGIGWRVAAGAAMLVTGFTIYDLVGRALYLQAMSLSMLTVAALTLVTCGLHLRWRTLA